MWTQTSGTYNYEISGLDFGPQGQSRICINGKRRECILGRRQGFIENSEMGMCFREQ